MIEIRERFASDNNTKRAQKWGGAAAAGHAAENWGRLGYLLGEVINKAYVDKDVRGIALLSLVTVVLYRAFRRNGWL